MPIINIKSTPALCLEVKCALCSVVSSREIATLRLGTSAADLNGILLPACVCGAQELLVRTFDGDDDERAAHRKAVNAVAIFLKSAGLVHPEALEAIRAETRTPTLTRPLPGPV